MLNLLAARFPDSEVMGVDGSRAMLEKARSAGFPTEVADIANWAPPEPVDIINPANNYIQSRSDMI